MKPIICFIDDSDFEHDIVHNEIAPFAPGIEFVQAYTFEEAQDLLEGKIPYLFLLDLWGKDEDIKNPYITPREELEKEISRIPDLNHVYDGLDNYRKDRTNEYLKRVFSIVDSWRSLFEKVCDRIGQNRKYGLKNLQLARKYYPGVPCVFYTRKSLINDAVAMIRAGTDGLFIKPTGKTDLKTRNLTRGYAPELIEELTIIIDSNLQNLTNFESFYSNKDAAIGTDLKSYISSWKEFINK